MAEDTEKVETATTTETETKVAETTEAEKASAETKKTEAKAAQDFEQRVPLARLNKVIQERNQLRERLAAIERDRGTTNGDETDADDETLGKARKLIEETASKMLERELGVPLSKLKESLSASETASASAAERQWEKLCVKHKLDPENEDVQAYVAGLARTGTSLDKAMERAVKLFATSTKKAASVEETGITPTMTTSDQVFWNRKDAEAAASKGVKARPISLDEVLQRQKEQAAKR